MTAPTPPVKKISTPWPVPEPIKKAEELDRRIGDMPISEHVGKADWKTEKHVPVIECPDKVAPDQEFEVAVMVGKEIAHPNTTAHHIRWISLYFHPEGEKFSYQVARVEFAAHGEGTQGADTGAVYTLHKATLSMKTKKAGTLHAVSLCNIHGLWESERKVSVG